MLDINLDTDGANGADRVFKPTHEKNGVVFLETRDQSKRSLESSMTLSSVHLGSNATKINSKVNDNCVIQVDGVAEIGSQNMFKIEVVIDDETSTADRTALAFKVESAAKQLVTQIRDLSPVYL